MRDSRLVWTSDPEAAKALRESAAGKPATDAQPSAPTIRVFVDRKRRAGKSVTVASGFQLTSPALASLSSQLKKKCGSGGTAKEAEIEIQGEHVATLSKELIALGYRVKGS